MADTPLVNYSRYITSTVKTSGRNEQWLNRLNDVSAWVPNAPMSGSITVPVASAMTADTPADGTMLNNLFANTSVALTAFNRTVPISVPPSQARRMDFNPENYAVIAEQAGDSLRSALSALIIAGLVAATPGQTEALADGKIDFAAGTVTEFAAIDRAIGYVLSNSSANINDLTILVTPAAWANIFTYRNNAQIGAAFSLAGNTDFFTYNNIPIYPVGSTTTNWGSGGNACLYVVAREAVSLAFTDAYPHDPDRFWIPATDGYYKHLINGTGFYGVSNASLVAEITSGSS